ncbi:unnamed protein product [Lupinus luteus]|uniref:ATPase AAA-type core domain-containing protein n=1 Tax=Lupinus luteus TaxID=3873 RepID=A0AAV1YA36_LUPLU
MAVVVTWIHVDRNMCGEIDLEKDLKCSFVSSRAGRSVGLGIIRVRAGKSQEGKEICFRNRQSKLYTNSPGYKWPSYKQTMWSHIVLEHPATFETMAMELEKKRKIIEDLVTFSKSREFYARIGKVWKRGYLLYGPPGTGKSTMIAAMVNLFAYDVYDLELTAVKDNTAEEAFD